MTSVTPPSGSPSPTGSDDRGTDEAGLTVTRRSPVLRVVGWSTLAVVLVFVALRYLTNPEALSTSDRRVDASTPVGSPVFIGVFATPADFGRTLDVSGVRVTATATAEVTITPHLCRGGSVGATREPEVFCEEFVGTEDVEMGPGDEIVLEVEGAAPGVVSIDPVRVVYSQGLQRDVQPAGSRALVTFLGRAAG